MDLKSLANSIPQYLGLPVLENDQQDYDHCLVEMYFSLVIISCSVMILVLPQEWTKIFNFVFSFNSKSALPWQVVGSFSSNFFHSSMSHLLGNMYFFLIFAPLVEKKYGPYNFIITFFLCAFCSNFATLFFIKDFYSIGVSGTLAGFMGLIATTNPNLKFRIYRIFSIPCWLLVGAFFFVPDLISIMKGKLGGKTDHVNHFAHVFGFISGYAVSLIIIPISELERKKQVQAIKKIRLGWLTSYTLWLSILVGLVVPFFAFLFYERSFEKYILGCVNLFIYIKYSSIFAIGLAIIFLFVDSKLRYDREQSENITPKI